MSTSTWHRYAAAIVLAGTIPAAALANDRDLRATTVPAASCIEVIDQKLPIEVPEDLESEIGNFFFLYGFWEISGQGILGLRCPLSIHNIEISSTANNNHMSKFRVHYTDPDGRGAGAAVGVDLMQTVIIRGNIRNTPICSFNSNIHGNRSMGPTRALRSCPHDFTNGAFYWFLVDLTMDHDIQVEDDIPQSVAPQFVGIDFPR